MIEGRKSPEELLSERRDRFEKALRGLRPDRVPFLPLFHYFPARYVGLSYAEYSLDYQKFSEAVLRVYQDFDFDAVGLALPGAGMTLPLNIIFTKIYPDLAVNVFTIARAFHDILMDKYTKWPGKELPPSAPAQFLGGKFMEVDEYDELATDPVSFLARKLIPRAYGALKEPASPEAYGALIKFGSESSKFASVFMSLLINLRKLGYPLYPIGLSYAPLDFIADYLRHVTHTLTDLYRYPSRVKAALNSLTSLISEWSKISISLPPEALALFDIKTPLVFIPLHLNEMIPPKLFKEFYWEPLKKVVVDLINSRAIPWIFFEGDYTPFLETLLELPRGSVVAYFERADLRRVRKVLGDHVIVMGGLPPSLYILGTPEKVYEETCKLLNEVKEPGGFIFSGSGVSGVPDETKPENLRAAIDALKKCGTY